MASPTRPSHDIVLLVVDLLFSCAHFVAGFARIQPVMLNSCESSYVWLRPQAASCHRCGLSRRVVDILNYALTSITVELYCVIA